MFFISYVIEGWQREVAAVRQGMNLSLQQQQKLIITQELRQALIILQMPLLELEAYLQQELLSNPVLEVREEPEEEPQPAPGPEAGDLGRWLEYLEGDGEVAPAWGRDEDQEDAEPGRTLAAPAPTLHDHLHLQLRLLPLPPAERRAAAFLIDSLDDNGYLTLALDEAARLLGLPLATVEAALRAVQGLEPPGVGARDLKECLHLQWAALGDGNPLVPQIIEYHLDDLAAGRITRIAEQLRATPAQVQAAADALRRLDPKPGRTFGRPGDTRYVVPDVVVERVGGEYVVLVNDAGLPRLHLSPAYRRILESGQGLDPEARRFLEGRWHSALWLLRAIEQRRLTLYRVAEAVVRLQRPFFDRGVRHLRPLTLREVAAEIGMHESTVSRATAGKYVQTPHGLFEFKFFFSSGVEAWGGDGVSAESVKRLIRDLVAQEDPRNPLSDQAIAQALARQGIRISRRTVAKYREEAGIPASARRKRYG